MLLEIQNLHVFYGHIHAVKGISLHVQQGEIVTLIGANGAGKSTTLLTVAGVIPATRGAVHFDGRVITARRMDQIARLGLNLVPEGRRIFPEFTVDEHLRIGAYGVRSTARIKALREQVYTLFPRLYERLHQSGGTLSGGEQQMLAIARGLMADPKLLILDEPSLGLAPILTEAIFEYIQRIHQQGMTVLLVEQNARLALQLAQRGYVLETGQIVLAGEARALLANARVQQAYLGLAETEMDV